MKILLTGFEPFGGEATNPSWEVVASLPDVIDGIEIVKMRLPVSFTDAAEIATIAINRVRPDAVIAVGQAGGRACINVERIAVNLANAKNPDCSGYKPVNEKILKDAPDAYFTTIPTEVIVEAVREAGIPCHPSNSAGLYVCNTLLFILLHRFPSLPITFLHLPYSHSQAVTKGKDTPSMSLATMVSALRVVVTAI